MKSSKFINLMAVVMLTASPLLWSACSDAFDEHYNSQGGNTNASNCPSLLENMKSDPSISNFYKVICGLDADSILLNSLQPYTVFAPTNDGFTAEQADSVIAVYEEDKAKGLKVKDNRAYTQFLQNQIASFSYQVFNGYEKRVMMLNRKYMDLVGTSASSGTMQNVAFGSRLVCNNGVIYKAERKFNFGPNILEYMKINEDLSCVNSFVTSYNEEKLDESSSVPGGIVDGQQVYLDSVTYINNKFLTWYGYVQREDSNYIFLAPTNEVWKRDSLAYSQYFKYAEPQYSTSIQTNGKTIAENNTCEAILMGRFFNVGKSQPYNKHVEDSICNTNYFNIQQIWPRSNVYYKPNETLFAGLKSYENSNGKVYLDNDGRIDASTTFLGRREYIAHYATYYQVPKGSENHKNHPDEDLATVRRGEYKERITKQVLDEDGNTVKDENGKVKEELVSEKDYPFVEFKHVEGSEYGELYYRIPNTFSNVYYNMYFVTVPNTSELPAFFEVYRHTRDEKNIFESYKNLDSDCANEPYYKRTKLDKFTNLVPYTATSYPGYQVVDKDGNHKYDKAYESFSKTTGSENAFMAHPVKVDTVLVAQALKMDFSAAGADPELRIIVKAWGSSGDRDKLYTRTIRLNKIVLVPFATEAEAKANALNFDAINDEKLSRK